MEGDPYPHLHQHQHQFISRRQQQHTQCNPTSGEIISYQNVNIDAGELGDGDRFPQWNVDETRELLMIRGELELNFMENKCTKLLWGVIANKMKFKGYNRSADQCKSKWKNLVTRYKGCETLEGETLRQQFPFYHELQVIFMQRMLMGEGDQKSVIHLYSDEGDEENNENVFEEEKQQQQQYIECDTTSGEFISHHHVNIDASGLGDGDTFPQWSVEEIREFLMIRGELELNFMENKCTKILWEFIANKMKFKGYNRSADRCKSKWKNLVTCYKGCETMEEEALRVQQFPFYNELRAIFMPKMLWPEDQKSIIQLSSDEEEENINEDSEEEVKSTNNKKKKRKLDGHTNNVGTSGNLVGSLKEMLDDFMKKQMEFEMQWKKDCEKMEEERRKKEMEWREKMEALQNDRLMMEKRWREREEQRRMKEQARDEKRDALIDALVNKLRREEDTSDHLS